VRTRYVSEVEALKKGGADEVNAEEFETSVEIFTVVLNKYFVPRDRIATSITDVRANGYRMLRSRKPVQGTLSDLIQNIPNITITAFTVEHTSPLDGKTLGEFNLRKRYNLLVLAIRRGEAVITGQSGEFQIEGGDIAIVNATPEDIDKGAVFFKQGEK